MRRFPAFLFGVALLLVQACHPEPYLTVNPTNLSFSQDGGSQTVKVSANYAWTASANGAGISVSPTSGEGEASVTITAATATASDPVTGTVTFRSEGLSASVSVSQDARSVISVGSVATIPAEGGSFTVDVQYNTDITVDIEASAKSWITFNGTKALQSGKLEFTFAENGSTDPRSGKVTVKDKAGKVSPITLTFVQEEKKVIQVGDTMTIPAEGGNFEVDVQYNTDIDVVVESSAQSWITFVKTKALTSGKLEFSFAANDQPDPRTGTVTVKDKAGKVSPITLTFVQEEKKVIQVGDTMTIPAEGGNFEVDVQYNTEFDVIVESSARTWITFVQTKALTSGKLEFSFAANRRTEPRTGTVTVRDKAGKVSPITLTFVQEEKKVIEVGETMTIPADGGFFEVDVRYNTDFDVEVDSSAQSWINFIKTKALTNGKLEFLFAYNGHPDPRTGTVTVKDKTGKVNPIILTFVQEERKMIVVGDITTISDVGGTYRVDVEYNTDFDVEVDSSAQSWITFIQTRALTRGKLEFYFAANEGEERTGNATIKDKAGIISPITLTFVQKKQSTLSKARRMMEPVYEAWGARNWKRPWIPGKNWPGLYVDEENGTFELYFSKCGINQEIPECIGELGDMLTRFSIYDEPDLTGSLPDSFRKLTNLESLRIQVSGMTSLPEVFGDMDKLEEFVVHANEFMTGPLPQSLQSPVLNTLIAGYSQFTGEIPSSWARYAAFMEVEYNCLTGKISHLFRDREEIKAFAKNANLWQKPGYGFDISDLDIPGYDNWFEGQLLENLDGTTFSIPEVVSKNKYTVYLYWALWCPFSKELMPQLKDYYDKYKQDGLEIIATIQVEEGFFDLFYDYEKQKKECIEKGYDGWYNYYWAQYAESYKMSVPYAEVYDQQGNILFSCYNVPDPERKRFNKIASSQLIPFLETLLGPAEVPDPYESTDYSKDGEVLTLQNATVGNGVDIVFLGDGYTDRDMGSGGLYETVMRQAMEEFFAEEPYKSFRNRFNVYAVKAVSKNGRVGEGYSTALSSYFGNGSYIEGNHDKSYEYALKVPSITSRDNLLVVVLANSLRHAGTTFMFSDGQTAVAYLSSMANDPDVFGDVIRHEAGGHGFAFLADEYTQYEGTAPADHIAYYNDAYDRFGWFSNVDFTNDPSKIRWSAFLSDDRYKNQVGIYEGAALYPQGAWRPTQNSIMKDNYGGFNAPSRWAIYQQIMKRSGESYSFDTFLEYDAVNLTAAAAAAAAARPPLKAAANPRTEHTAPPVIVR